METISRKNKTRQACFSLPSCHEETQTRKIDLLLPKLNSHVKLDVGICWAAMWRQSGERTNRIETDQHSFLLPIMRRLTSETGACYPHSRAETLTKREV